MAQSKKRRQSTSPARSQQPQEGPEYKKRKINGAMSQGSSSKIASSSGSQVARSSAPPASGSSSTLEDDSPPSKNKGKGVAKDPIILELEQLRKEVALKNEMLEVHEKTVAAVTQSLTCQICLELMRMPYALAPCGHVSCHACLVAWFTSPHNDHNGDEQNPEVEWYSESESSVDGDVVFPGPENDQANVEEGNVEAGNANNEPNPLNGNAPLVNGNAVPPPPQPPAMAPFPNSVHRRKTCPHCRCIIKERPVQVYALKDLVGIINPSSAEPQRGQNTKKIGSKEAGNGKKKERDPWRGIFRPSRGPGGGHGGEDPWDDQGNMWPGWGPGGGHPPYHPLPTGFFEPDDDPEEEVISQQPLPLGPHPHAPAILPNLDQGEGPQPPPPPFVDEEDGVRRCGRCLHEIWGGACTNVDCGVVYDDASEGGSDDHALTNYRSHGLLIHELEDEEDGVAWGARYPEFDGHGSDVEDGYESSFIDDADERRERGRVRESAEEDGASEDNDEDDFVPGPSRRWIGGGQETVIISSDEDEDDAPGPSNRTGRGRIRRIVYEDNEEVEEQEVEGDVGSVNEEDSSRGQLGFDGDESSGSHTSRPHSAEHSLAALEAEDETLGNEEVPYVWDEEDEEEEGRHDDVIYMYDEEDGDGSSEADEDEGEGER